MTPRFVIDTNIFIFLYQLDLLTPFVQRLSRRGVTLLTTADVFHRELPARRIDKLNAQVETWRQQARLVIRSSPNTSAAKKLSVRVAKETRNTTLSAVDRDLLILALSEGCCLLTYEKPLLQTAQRRQHPTYDLLDIIDFLHAEGAITDRVAVWSRKPGGREPPTEGYEALSAARGPLARFNACLPAPYPAAIQAADAPARIKPSVYPSPFAERMEGRVKHPLGDLFGLSNFGVNLTRLAPGACSALRHAHTRQDEFIYVIQGFPTLITDAGAQALSPGMCAGFKAGTGDAHQVVNRSPNDAVYLEIGDRSPDDAASYPDDDLQATLIDGAWRFSHKDGSPY